MYSQVTKFKQPKILFAVLGLTALAIAALAVTLAAGGAQAQTADNTYADPQPCGPGAGTAFMPEPHEVTTGRFLLFDTYWQNTTGSGPDDVNSGVLHTNTCPPKLVTTTQTDDDGNTTTVTTLGDSGIDIDEAIFHVLDTHKKPVVATNAEATAGQLSLEEYPEVRRALGLRGADGTELPVPDGTQVWWLQLDDPDTGTESSPVNETSDLALGFSARHLDGKYWHNNAGGSPLFYRLEVERHPTHPNSYPHLLAHTAPEIDNTPQTAKWSSARVGVGVFELEPGQFQDLQWVFTGAGTYEIRVEMVAYVRQASNPPVGADADWEPISENETETSEVKRYIFQVGDLLAEQEPPVFGVNLSVPENSAAGTAIGDPIPVYRTESTILRYLLAGEGSDQFTTEALTEPHRVQIKVAGGASLDFETQPAYDLTLGVSNAVDHEGNPDDVIDDVLAVAIEILDAPELSVSLDTPTPQRNEAVRWTARIESLPGDATNVVYHWSIYSTGVPHWTDVEGSTGSLFILTGRERFGDVKARVYATYTDGDGNNQTVPAVESDWAHWQ